VLLESLPLTPNGKLDRKALPMPEGGAYAVHGYQPPQGETEAKLAKIWAQVLHLQQVGRHDNFFELGGHSLLVVSAVGLLEQVGITIPTVDVFMHPTVQSLAATIRSRGPYASTDDAICIRQDGDEPPIFFAHCGDGELSYASTLANYIDGNIPIYGLPWTMAKNPTLYTVEGMSARMVQMIRAVQPFGPYRVAGWSFGGTLAYEIAAQLIGADQKVEFLGLFDTQYSAGIIDLPELPVDDSYLKDRLLFMLQMGERPDAGRQAAIDEIKLDAATMNLAAMVQKCQEKYLIPSQLTTTKLKRFFARAPRFIRATTTYRAQRIPIPVHLFATQEQNLTNPHRGWNAIVPDNMLRIIQVPGTHLSMTSIPHAETLGKAISHAICIATEDARELAEMEYSPLIPLQSGPRNTTPLFCLPGAGGNVTSFLELVTTLGDTRPIYGLQPRGVDGVLVPHSTVLSASASCLRAIDEIHPKGSIHLLGHSFGGWVAFEIAQQLGSAIASLTILDSDAPDEDDSIMREYTNTEALMKWVDIFELILGHPIGVTQSDLDSRTEREQRDLLHHRLVTASLVPRSSNPEILRGPLRAFAASLRTHYKTSGVYLKPVRLILTDDPRLDRATNERERERLVRRWRVWAPNLICKHAPGNHLTVLNQPNVRALAAMIPNSWDVDR
jgi:thioesterase domain-containing protein